MSSLTEAERALYGQTLIEMDDQELLDERLERMNEMLADNVAVVGGRNNPTMPRVLEALQEDARRSTERLGMASAEIERRREEAANEQPQQPNMTIAQQEAALNVARAAALENMIERARDLTDLMTTTRSMMLQLAGDLPSEGRYNPVTWGYKPVVAGAQDAVKTLVEAWQATDEARSKVEMAARQIRNMQQRFEHEMTGADPDEFGAEDLDDDGIPF